MLIKNKKARRWRSFQISWWNTNLTSITSRVILVNLKIFRPVRAIHKCLFQCKITWNNKKYILVHILLRWHNLIVNFHFKTRNTWDDSSWQFLSFFDLWLCFSLATECWRSRTVGQIEIRGKTCTPLTPRVHSGLTWLAHRLWSVRWHHRQWRPVIPL